MCVLSTRLLTRQSLVEQIINPSLKQIWYTIKDAHCYLHSCRLVLPQSGTERWWVRNKKWGSNYLLLCCGSWQPRKGLFCTCATNKNSLLPQLLLIWTHLHYTHNAKRDVIMAEWCCGNQKCSLSLGITESVIHIQSGSWKCRTDNTSDISW